MQFRIGINLGDVIVEGERLYGDGVNIAARLESLAIPAASASRARCTTKSRTSWRLSYEYQGEQTVKNIAKPVRVYRVRMDEPTRSSSRGKGQPSHKAEHEQVTGAGAPRRTDG